MKVLITTIITTAVVISVGAIVNYVYPSRVEYMQFMQRLGDINEHIS